MTLAISSPDSTQRRPSRLAAVSSTESKVTPIGRARRKNVSPQPASISVPTIGRGATPTKVAAVKILPNRQLKPVWLRSLLSIQRTSSVITFLLLSCTLTVYGWTVYGQQRWSEEYQKLETLRRSEQQLSAASVVLKHQIATAAENPETGLAPQQPQDMIFLEPAPERQVPAANLDPQSTQKSTGETPLGY
ncbi:hypothetical protein [Kamptonema sp. UHCC 0994]|uniref:hypothetical protein n=1 Tax=Kamptonema sp. UHCC 0994 TaxID=3031329 RepID=UPI0023B9D4B4|nr:hypothetical protein [Kamptonema sp. UHCC 0994]MDF0553978.1 hypothetical protein [Kamptonema sp. UHCC 0994]